MWKNQFKIAFRNIFKHKLFSVINIFGLGIGLASFLLISLYIQKELDYDKGFSNAEDIYRIAGSYQQGGEGLTTLATTPFQLAPILKEQFPEIRSITRILTDERPLRVNDQFYPETDIYYGDPDFFEVFPFEFISGDRSTALTNPSTVVITESIAKKYFKTTDVIGEVLDFNGYVATVTGVIRTPTTRGHIRPSFVVSTATVEGNLPDWMITNWGGTSHWTYLVTENAHQEELGERFSSYINTTFVNDGHPHTYFLQPFGDIYLKSNILSELESGSDIIYIYIFSIVSILVLLIATINYVNLSIAGSTFRVKEVGLRRTLGAAKRQMVFQFQIESIVLAVFAAAIALVMVESFIPTFNQLTQSTLEKSIFANSYAVLFTLFISIAIGTVAGTFPGLFLLKIKTLNALKGQLSSKTESVWSPKNILIVLQFSASIILITGTLLIFKQLNFIQNQDLGFNTEHVIQVPLQTNAISERLELFKQELSSNAEISAVTGISTTMTSRVGGWRSYKLPDKEDWVNVPTMTVDIGFIETLGINVLEGRDFSKEFPTDNNQAYVINEAAQKFLSLEEPIGQSIIGSIFTGSEWNQKEARIIGVVKDFNLASLHSAVQPLILSIKTPQTRGFGTMLIRVQSQDLASTVKFIESKWNSIAPERPFVHTFMEDDLADHYLAENNFFNLLGTFSTLAILIGCMGLFGLSVYTIQRRIKEIGIRKVLGAKVTGLVGLLSWDFIKLILISNLIAWPVAYYSMDLWLEEFAYRISIGIGPFVIAGAMAILVAFLTISLQTLKTSLSNPIQALKDE